MGLDHAVLTMVARDDLADGGMAHVAACVAGDPRAPAGHAGRDADLRRPRLRGVARRAVRRAARRAQPQRRDGGPAAAGGAAVGRLRPQPVGAGPGQGGRADDEVGADRRDGRDRRGGRRRASPTSPGSASTSSRSASTCARRRTTCPSSAGSSRRTFADVGRRPARRSASRHVEASPLTRSSYHAKVRRRSRHPGRHWRDD